jgi:hypothetical protein
MQWSTPLIPEIYKIVETINVTTQLRDLNLQQERVFKRALIPCSTKQGIPIKDEHLQ